MENDKYNPWPFITLFRHRSSLLPSINYEYFNRYKLTGGRSGVGPFFYELINNSFTVYRRADVTIKQATEIEIS